MELDLSLVMETARRAVDAAARAALRFHRQPLDIEWKADRSPVTRADREAEAAILDEIRRSFPGHGILAEESGESAGDGESRWIVDPLDGTRGFSRGGSFWGPLVALEHRGEIVAGAMALPALDETYWAARGQGSFRNGERIQLSKVGCLEDATLSLGEIRALLDSDRGRGVRSLVSRVSSTRCYGDVAGCALLLSGRADVWIEAGVKLWDLAALQVLVEEAGGRFTDFDGARSLAEGRAVASNALLHDAVVRALES